MSLILSIVNVERLENGVATRLRLDRHGAVIGRSPHVDWSLPDPNKHISSTHCEIEYRDGGYTLVDKSTNGTFLNGASARMQGPHRLADGDVILVGAYEITARLEGADATAPAAPAAPAWTGWDSHAAAASPAPAAAASDWAKPAPQSAISGMGPMSQQWAAPAVSGGQPASSAWADPAPAPASSQPSAWSSPAGAAPAQPSAADVWGQLAAGNVVDWARGFSAPPPAAMPPGLAPQPPADPFGLAAPAAGNADAFDTPPRPPPTIAPGAGWGAAPAPVAPPAPAPAPPPAAPPRAPAGGEAAAFLAAAGLGPSDLALPPAEAMAAAGAALRKLIGGVVVMLEARARAKQQLGAQGTALELAGNNPLKFARTPEQALAQLLNPPQRGFMPADRAVEDAFQDLQAHQMATLAAMQGALRATLARFSPEAIRNRAETGGILAKILPGAHDAALWHAYAREFEGVARGSDEAFMDVFAREFRQAYEKAASELKRQS